MNEMDVLVKLILSGKFIVGGAGKRKQSTPAC